MNADRIGEYARRGLVLGNYFCANRTGEILDEGHLCVKGGICDYKLKDVRSFDGRLYIPGHSEYVPPSGEMGDSLRAHVLLRREINRKKNIRKRHRRALRNVREVH